MLKNKTVSRLFLAIFCLFTAVSLTSAESCSRSGTTQDKYTARGCSYTTQTRTCCGNYQWSEWGKDCTCNYDGQGCDDWQIYADWDPVACKCICPANASEVDGVCECNPGYEEINHECVKTSYKITTGVMLDTGQGGLCKDKGEVKTFSPWCGGMITAVGMGVGDCSYKTTKEGEIFTCNEDGRDVRDCESSNYAKVCAKWGSGFQCIAKYLNTERYYYTDYTCKMFERRPTEGIDDPNVSEGSCEYINPKEYSMEKHTVSIVTCD